MGVSRGVLLVVVLVVCLERGVGSESEDAEDGASLAIVFDTTRSMYPELDHVKRRAAEILKAALTRQGWPVRDFVLAPFNDPRVPKATLTADPAHFQELLEGIVVDDGGDCSEKALTGLLNALELIRPRDGDDVRPGTSASASTWLDHDNLQRPRSRSTVFVFTDASAKDYHLVPRVLQIVQRKQPVVVFVTSGTCKEEDAPSRAAFSEIASISSGHIFQLNETDVDVVMNFLDRSLKEHKVNLLSVDKGNSSEEEHTVLVDPTIHEILVAVSGSNPEITVTNPSGEIVDQPPYVVPVVDLENVKVIALREPDPGSWKINTSSSSPHSVRLTGVSTIDFIYGFSAQHTDLINETYHRPLQGAENFILVASSSMGSVWNLTTIELTALNGTAVENMTLSALSADNGFYRAGPFVPPDAAFYLTSYGFGEDGFPLKRITPTAILPELPEAPQIHMQPEQTALIGHQTSLYCQIESLVPVSAWWTKDGTLISKLENYRQTTTLVLPLDVRSEDAAGQYRCLASNSRGNAWKAVNVAVTGPPPEAQCPAEKEGALYGRLVLECSFVSSLRFNTSWALADTGALNNDTRYTLLPNGTLVIDPVQLIDRQMFSFTISNAAGNWTSSVQVGVSVGANITVDPTAVVFERGQPFMFGCSASEGVDVVLHWEKAGVSLMEDDRFVITSNGSSSVIQVKDPKAEDEGLYKCVAFHPSQSKAVAESNATARFVEAPQVSVSDASPLLRVGDNVNVNCTASGAPTPQVAWLRLQDDQRQSLVNFVKYEVLGGIGSSGLVIYGASLEDNNGVFICEARNEVGEAEAVVRLQVGSPPHIIGDALTKTVPLELSQSGFLPCNVAATPKPKVTWRRVGGELMDEKRFRVDLETGHLHISDVQVEDDGAYECQAENVHGVATIQANLTVYGFEAPSLDDADYTPALQVVAGNDVVMNCANRGNPKPKITWHRNENILESDARYMLSPNGSLTIQAAQAEDTGQYYCDAENKAGLVSFAFDLRVIAPPVLKDDATSLVTAEKGEEIHLFCDASAKGSPFTVLWMHNGQPMQSTDDIRVANESLFLSYVNESQSGVYVCQVSNEAGGVNRSFSLDILTPPKIDEGLHHLSVVSEVNVFLSCVVSGNPAPNVSWTKDDAVFNVTDERYPTERGLVLLGVGVQDTGSYTCTAENVVSVAASTTRLEVSVPAWIEESGSSEIAVLEGERVFLPCEPHGTPLPDVGWTFRGLPLDMRSDERLKVTEAEGLELLAAREADSGAYTCSVANSAGSDSQTVNLMVNVPARITSWQPNATTVLGQPVELGCVAYGSPEPQVTWYRGDDVLSLNSSLRFVAEPARAGVYRCVASNVVGSDAREVDLSVLVPPQVKIPTESVVVLSLGVDVELACLNENVRANPPAELSWFFNGTRLSAEDPLILSDVGPRQAGVYHCNVSNVVGNATRTFDVKVYERPHILEKLPSSVTLLEGEDFSMKCTASGNPPPIVSWYRADQLIQPGSEKDDLLLMTDNTLVIVAASNLTGGNYSCVALNEEGTDRRSIDVQVYAPPPAVVVNVTSLELDESQVATLTCPGSGPATWYKDGLPVNFEENNRADAVHYAAAEENNTLKVFDLSLSDNGNYSCVNGDGQEGHFQLNVLSPPYFDDPSYSEEKTFVDGESVVLDCRSWGNPTPKVIWKKNESVPVTQHTTPGVVIVQSSRHQLSIPSIRLHHAGRYRCTAVNKAGQNHRSFLIRVIVAPDVIGGNWEKHEVMVGANVTLECPISGQPKPTIVWERVFDGNRSKVIPTQGDFQQTMLISPANLKDSGEYTCTGTNRAGSKSKRFKVEVLDAPSIADNDGPYHVLVPKGGSATLECSSRGWPKPSVYWLRNGHVLHVLAPSERRTSSLNETHIRSELVLRHLGERDGGSYVCTASNLGGSAEKIFALQILVAPSFEDGSDTNKSEVVAVPVGRPASLRCSATGQPAPEVTWFKNGQEMDSEALERRDTLSLLRVADEDAGNYSCIASNLAGNVSKNYLLDVLVPPSFVGQPGPIEYDVLQGESLTLFCNVSGRPTPHLIWLKGASPIGPQDDARRIFLQSNNLSLVIGGAELWHSGRYSCVASNEAGSEEVAFILRVSNPPHRNEAVTRNYSRIAVPIHRRTALVCAVQGYPQPNITWLKDDAIISEGMLGEHAHVSADGRQLLILQASLDLSGDYLCRAENRAGVVTASFTLEVDVPAEWSEWSEWGPCSVSCDSGLQERFRECVHKTQPERRNECDGSPGEEQVCFGPPCPVNGGWTCWSAWSPCNQSCGPSFKTRHRKCARPEPQAGGEPCHGDAEETAECLWDPCPVDGSWSAWSAWSDCSATCGGGVKQRSRLCDSPAPQHGGRECLGTAYQKSECEAVPCPLVSDSSWNEWSPWSRCSASCGPGHQVRRRTCPKRSGVGRRPTGCQGENLQIQACKRRCKAEFPPVASLRVRGEVNGRRVRSERFLAHVVADGNLVAKVRNISKRQAIWQNWMPFILSPVSWSIAKEDGQASNGYTLTQGSFKQTSQVVFESGEKLSLEHEVKGSEDNSSIHVDVKVQGSLPRAHPRADVSLDPITEDLVQTGANSLQSVASSAVIIDGSRIPYTWNKTIIYDADRGTMPYRTERLSTKGMSTETTPNLQEMRYSEETIVSHYDDDRCPTGFQLDRRNRHCTDVDECEARAENGNGCHPSQLCENLIGSYRCSCPEGYRSLGFGKPCLDVNECMTRPPLCSHDCRNVPGSYLCICPVGMTLREDRHICDEIQSWNDDEDYDEDYEQQEPDFDRIEAPSSALEFRRKKEDWACPRGSHLLNGLCADVDECVTPDVCSEHETCLNTRGGFECIDTSCPPGYHKFTDTYDCVKLCGARNSSCDSGALVAESRSFTVLTLEPEKATAKSALVHLAVSQEGTHTLPRTVFRFVDGNHENVFKVREEDGRGVLYSTRSLEFNRIYRVTVEATSFADAPAEDEDAPTILYITNFFVTLYVLN